MPAHHAKRPLLVVANARYCTSYGSPLRLDQQPFDVLLVHARKLAASEVTSMPAHHSKTSLLVVANARHCPVYAEQSNAF